AAEVVDSGVVVAGATIQALAACGDTGVTLPGLRSDGAGQPSRSRPDPPPSILGDGFGYGQVDLPHLFRVVLLDLPQRAVEFPQALDLDDCLHGSARRRSVLDSSVSGGLDGPVPLPICVRFDGEGRDVALAGVG